MRMPIANFKKSRAELTIVNGTGDSNTIKRDEKKRCFGNIFVFIF